MSDLDQHLAFILGHYKSGSTWLANLLCLHPDVMGLRETHVFRYSQDCADFEECSQDPDPIDCFASKNVAPVRELECLVEIAPKPDGDGGTLCSIGIVADFPNCEEVVILALEGPPNAAESVTFDEGQLPAFAGARHLCGGEASLNLGTNSRLLDRGARILALLV